MILATNTIMPQTLSKKDSNTYLKQSSTNL